MPFTLASTVEVLVPVFRLFAFTAAGFLVFKIPPVQKRLLDPFVWLTMNIIFPLYFIHALPMQWEAGVESGLIWAAVFFAAYLVFLGVQVLIAKLLINRVPLFQTEHPRELLVIFAMQNAGYVPLPIIVALAPAVVALYLSFYLVPFIILFFTVAVWIIQGSAGKRTGFRLNTATVGIVLGLIIAATGIYPGLPPWVQAPFRFSASIALDAVMVVLGAILASIPAKSIRYRKEFGGYILVKMIALPAVVMLIMMLVPIRSVPPAVAAGIKLAMVLEAAVPAATNILVITKAYGTRAQVEYAGAAIIYTYLAALVLLPAFLVLSRMLFN